MSALGRAIYWVLGGMQAVVEFVATGRRLVKAARKGTLPDDTDPFPLRERQRIYLRPPPLPREPLKRR